MKRDRQFAPASLYTRFEGIAIFGLAGEAVFFNDRMLRILGCSADDIPDLEHFIGRFLPDECHAGFPAIFDWLRSCPDDGHLMQVIDVEGGKRWCRIACSSNMEGEHIILHCLECTPNEEEKTAFHLIGRCFKHLFEEAKDAISIYGTEIMVNKAWRDLFGYDPREMEFFDPACLYVNSKNAERFMKELEENGYIHDFEAELRKKNGDVVICLYTAHVFKDNEGNRYSLDIIRDITNWKRMEAALIESEERYRTLFESSMDAIEISSRDMRYIDVNQSWLKLFGYTREEVVGRDVTMIIDNVDNYSDIRAEIMKTGYVHDIETIYRRSDGAVIDVLLTLTPRKNGENEIIGFQGFIRDITERKKVERALKVYAEFQQRISSISTNFINLPTHEIDSGITHALRIIGEFMGGDRGFLYRYTGNQREFVLTHEWRSENYDPRFDKVPRSLIYESEWVFACLNRFEIVRIPSLSFLERHISEVRDLGELEEIKSFILVPMIHNAALTGFFGFESLRKERAWDDESFSPLKLVGEMLVNAMDKNLAERCILENQKKLRSIASELTLTEERERRRIAIDLHDRIAQPLAVSRIKLGVLKELVSSPEQRFTLDEVSDFISEAINDTRSLIFEISPPILYDLGLEPALEWLAESILHPHGIGAVFKNDGKEKPLEQNIRVLLFQCTREVLMNAVKHSQAKSVVVSVSRREFMVDVVVEDDGIGFESAEIESKSMRNTGFGLFSIRERLEHSGGILRVESKSGCGTRISLSAPITRGNIS